MVSDGSFNSIEDFNGTAGIISGSATGGSGGSGTSVGGYYIWNAYSPADNNGSITFPNHNSAVASLDPNAIDDGGYALYINQYDSSGNDQSSILDDLVGNSGTLTLTQGSNSVTYSFTSTAFGHGGSYSDQYYWDPTQESSPANGIVVTSPASSDFIALDPITITVTI